MSVDIDPLELSFRRPFTQEVSQTLTLKNPHPHPVAFKVKTTAPKQYCVRPNAGRIEAGQDFDVTVLLQAMKAEPAPDAKCRDKFLVQSAPITGDKEFASITSVLETTDKSSLSEKKIRVNWLAASSDSADHDEVPAVVSTPHKQTSLNGTSTDTPEASRSFSSPEASHDTFTPSAAPPPYSDDKKEPVEEKGKPVKQVVNETAATVASAAVKVKEKAEQELRQRNIASGASTTTQKQPAPTLAQAVSPAAQGVPVKITALLCFLAFLIAYFFF